MTSPLYGRNLPSEETEPADGLDYYPTPGWATRALFEHCFGPPWPRGWNIWEPACGAGHMSKVLEEYCDDVRSSDLVPRGYGAAHDFLEGDPADMLPDENWCDWIITNPPYSKAADFLLRALDTAHVGVAMLLRIQWLETPSRWREIFGPVPPHAVHRVHAARGHGQEPHRQEPADRRLLRLVRMAFPPHRRSPPQLDPALQKGA